MQDSGRRHQYSAMRGETKRCCNLQLLSHQAKGVATVVMLLLLPVAYPQIPSNQESTPKITREITVSDKATSIELPKGASPYFLIEAQGLQPLQYVWYQDDIVIQNNTSPLLTIQSVQISQSGIYRCLVYNKLGACRSLPFSLTVKELGVWPTNMPSQMVTVKEREFVVLNVPEISYFNDFVRITWQKDNRMVLSGGLNTYKALDHSLAILNIPLSYEGSHFKVSLMHYPLSPGASVTTVSNDFVFNVAASTDQSTFIAPQFVIRPKDVIATAGTNIKMECVIYGQPFNNLQITWFKGFGASRTPITPGDIHLLLSSNMRVLTIKSVAKDDAGVYGCEGTVNQHNQSVSHQATLTVIGAPPTLVQSPQSKTVAEHEDTGFTCTVTGGPRPEKYWTKDGVNVTIGGRIRITQQQLLIGRAELADSGSYKCNAVNIKGSVAAEAVLTVVVKTQIIKPPQSKSSILSTDTEMECGVRSDPTITPVWTWFFTPTYASEASYAYLAIPAPPLTPAIYALSIIVPYLTALPDDPAATGSTSTEASWETVNSDVDPALRSIVVEDLLPSKFYRFRMIAVNRVNESPPSEPAPKQAIKMPAQPPSEAPKNLHCLNDGERRIKVGWDPPPTSSWNGDLQGYYVYYKVSAFGEEKRVDVKGAETRQTIIDFLAYNMQYRIIIAAYNEKGAGVRSGPYYVTTLQGTPAAPPKNVELTSPDSTTIKVEWDPPDSRFLNGINKGYDIDVVQGSILERVENVLFDASNPTGRQVRFLTQPTF
ncbi:protein sidekick-1 [Elysia marginata]|uniref:Protein sidekick-1 n=1 Tax=Elysia marginata TaxID=1093978 RepID=A0AAV4HQ84_9GAST|nr:protein sidekick-1 [Elysia marginata]